MGAVNADVQFRQLKLTSPAPSAAFVQNRWLKAGINTHRWQGLMHRTLLHAHPLL